MHIPRVGERVSVSGCRDEFIVVDVDHATCIATIVSSERVGATRRLLPFSLLLAPEDFKAAQEGMEAGSAGRDVIRSSQMCIHRSQVYTAEMRNIVQNTMMTIRKSQELLAASSELIERSRTLDGFRPPTSIQGKE